MQGMEYRAFSSTVCTEEQRDGSKIELYSISNTLKVFNRNSGNHSLFLFGNA